MVVNKRFHEPVVSEEVTAQTIDSASQIMLTRPSGLYQRISQAELTSLVGGTPTGNVSGVAYLPTVADMRTTQSFVDGQLVITEGYHVAGDGGGQANIYRTTGRSALTATIDEGFYFLGYSTDDYFEAADKSVVDPLKFGVRLGTTDSHAALQAAVNAAVAAKSGVESTLNGGPKIVLPGGKISISAPIVVNNTADAKDSHLHFHGHGNKSTVITPVSGSTATEIPFMVDVTNTGGNTGNRWVTFEGIAFIGFESEEIGGIDLVKAAYCSVRNCTFTYCHTGVKFRNWSHRFTRNRFEWGDTQLHISAESGIGGTINSIVVQENYFASGNYGIRTDPSLDVNSLSITRNEFDGVTLAGILINGPCDNCVINDNYFEAQGRKGPAIVQRHRLTGSETNWASGTAYSTGNIVLASDSKHYLCVNGGTSAGNDSDLDGGSDTGCRWIAQSVEINAGVVIHPTYTNTDGCNFRFTNNKCFTGNTDATLSFSGGREVHIEGNTGSGDPLGSFVRIENASRISIGPLPYTLTRNIYIEGSRYNISGRQVWGRLVELVPDSEIASTGGYSDPMNGLAGITVKERFPTGSTRSLKPLVLNDLSSPNFKVDKHINPAYKPFTKVYQEDNSVAYKWTTSLANQTMTFTKDEGTHWSGFITVLGEVHGDDEGAKLKVDVTDGYRIPDVFTTSSGAAGEWAVSRNQIGYIEEYKGHADKWTLGTTYSAGDVVKASTGEFFRLSSTSHTSSGDDSNLFATGAGNSSDAGAGIKPWIREFNSFYVTWATSRSYVVGDIVKASNGSYYRALSAHTSSGDDTNLVGGSGGGSWSANTAPDWTVSTAYSIGDRVRSATDERYYIATTAGTSGGDDTNLGNGSDPGIAWAPSHRDPEDVSIRVHTTGSAATTGTIRNFALCSTAFDRLTHPLDVSKTGDGVLSQLNAKNYGAMADGTTDDTDAVKQLFDDAADLELPVVFPRGTYNLATWGVETFTKDIEIICDDGVVINGPGTTVTFLELTTVSGTSFKWTGGKVQNFKRFLNFPRIDGDTTPRLHVENLECENVSFVIEESNATSATTPATIENCVVRNIVAKNPEVAISLITQQFENALFEKIHIEGATSTVQAGGLWLGMNHTTTDHGQCIVRDVFIDNLSTAAGLVTRGLVLAGPNFTVDNVHIKDNVNSNGNNNEGMKLTCSNSTVKNCKLHNGGSGLATIFLGGADRGETHSFNYDNGSGQFRSGEAISWTSGTGNLIKVGPTKMAIELLTGSAPVNNDTITGGESAATGDVNGTVTARSEAYGHGVTIEGCSITRDDTVQAHAIRVGGSDCRVVNNYISGGKSAITSVGVRNVYANNTIDRVGSVGTSTDMVLIDAADNKLSGNTITRCGSSGHSSIRAISLSPSTYVITGTIISDNRIDTLFGTTQWGIRVNNSTTGTGQTKDITITGNQFANLDEGVHCDGTPDQLIVRSNSYVGTTDAVNFGSATNVTSDAT